MKVGGYFLDTSCVKVDKNQKKMNTKSTVKIFGDVIYNILY